MRLRNLALLALGGIALVGLTACVQLAEFLGKWQPPCTIEMDRSARLFAIDAPETTPPGTTFSVVAWVSVESDLKGFVTPLPGTFLADVDTTAKTIRLSGKVRADIANPGAECAFIQGQPGPKGATVSIDVSAPAGIYTLLIPDAAFESHKPRTPPDTGAPLTFDYPEPMATRSIVIQ